MFFESIPSSLLSEDRQQLSTCGQKCDEWGSNRFQLAIIPMGTVYHLVKVIMTFCHIILSNWNNIHAQGHYNGPE